MQRVVSSLDISFWADVIVTDIPQLLPHVRFCL